MIAVVTILCALSLGFFGRSAGAASVAFVAVYTWAFVFQTLYLVLAAMGGDTSAFGPDEFPLSYGLVTLAVYVVGFAFVALGRHLRGAVWPRVRLRRRRPPERQSPPALAVRSAGGAASPAPTPT